MNYSTFRSKLPPILLLYFLSVIGFKVAAQSGKVFRDYNADGVKQTTEPLIAGVTVKAYNTGNTECATATSLATADGSGNNYSLTGCSGSVRVEFTIPDAGCGLNPAVDYTSGGGTAYGSSVQFVTSSSNNVNFAVNAPEDYFTSADNPKLFVPCYLNGDPANTNVAAGDAFVNVKFDATGSITKVATAGQIGSTWGVADSKQANKVFTSAFLKRHVGLGPLGSGGIYMIDPITNAVTNWLDLDAIGIATQGSGTYAGSGPSASSSVAFTDVIGTNTQRNLGNGLNQPSYDAPALAQVGKLSLGDLDISDDGRYLFVVNLYDKKVYRIDLQNAQNPVTPTAANVTSWAIPAPTAGCANGEIRPFALEYARGSLFVGLVCSAENGGAKTDLKGYVYKVTDFSAGTHSELFDIDLDYTKGWAFSYFGNTTNADATTGWFPWTDNYSDFTVANFNIHPQPVLSDIVFDVDGSLILSFFDRTGHQSGWFNYGPNSTTLRATMVGGDLLRAFYNSATCTYKLENNGLDGEPTTAGKNNGQGPGGGEFYYKDCYDCTTGGFHRETVQGGIAMALGSGEIAATVIDPKAYDSGGLTWFNTTTGVDTKDFELYFTGNSGNVPNNGTFSKANGLGDLEVSGSMAPLEIGNRIWKDTDKDGIQDAGEDGVDGVEIELYEGTTATGSPVKTVTSATLAGQKGTWYFTGLKPNQDYVIKVKTALGAGVLATCTAFSPTGAGTPSIDNNTSTGTIVLKTGNAGENNHSFDIGVSEAPPVPKPGGWDFDCQDGVMVETVGKSGFGVSNPTANCTGSGTATIALPNGATADSIYIEAVYKTTNPGPTVTFVANSTNYVAQRYQLPLGDAWVYRTKVPATASISLTDGTKFCALQSLVAYVFRKSSGKASVGVFTCEQGYQSTVTVNLPLPTLTKASDVTVCVPISELTNDGRLLTIRATAGTIVKDTVISGSDPAFGACCLAIPKLKLVNVPAGTTTVKVEVISANSPAGQSFTVASAISANVECEKCVKPVAAATPQTKTICVGGTATAFTATPSTGVEYKWYGPLTTTTGSLGTAIAGQTAAAFTPTGAALTTEGTKYYAVVVNTTGDATCADTAFVTLVVSKITVPAATAQCHANGTPEDASDDYMTFTIKVTDTPASLHTYTVTATQGGNPLAVTLSNGTPATAVNCGLNTPLRTPVGSAGKGNVTLTITNNVTGCSTTLTITDPGTCAVVCVSGTPSTVVYEYGTQVNITDLDKLPIVIPQFDQKGGTRVLQSVKLEYTFGGKTAFVFENRAAQSQTFEATGTSKAYIELNGSNIDTSAVAMPIPETTLPGGILVPAQGSWPGDTVQGSTPTTLGRMANWVSDYLSLCKDPRVDARWVTNATGDATDDDDMYVAPMVEGAESGSLTYNTTATLAPFIGTGLVPLNVSTESGLSLAGGGGNIFAIQRTRAFATAKVTYTYECVTLCTPPTRVVTATDPTCTVAGKIEITATNGDKYGVSKGSTYTGPAYAAATAVGTLPIAIKSNISYTADSTWTIRVFNGANDCFKDTTVTVKALVKDATISVNNGFPVCRLNGTAYTIKFTKSPSGAVVTAKNVATGAAIAVTGDSVASIPLTVAQVRLIVTNGVCKDSVDVTAPVCDKPVGSIGDLIWKDSDDNGVQSLPGEKGVAGVKVNLYAAAGGTKTGSVLQTKTTGTDGLYLFTGLMAGDYIVEIDKTTLPDTCEITTKQNIPSDDTKDSDFNPTTGLSQVITLNPVFNPVTQAELLATNNLTVDAGLVVPCVKSKVTVTAAPVCSADVQTYSLTFSLTGKNGIIKVNKGTLTGSNPYTVTGIPSGASITITDSLSAICKSDTVITGPNCNCNPSLPMLLTPSLTACIGDTFPTLKATVVGMATVEWFTVATGGAAVASGLDYKPTGIVMGDTVFYAQARSTDPACPAAISTSRVPATINAQDCTKEVDLALRKSINTKIAQIGDILTYTLKVWNESNTNATGVEVTDSIATTVQFQVGSFVPSRGTAILTGNVIKWAIGGIAANGDTVTLTYQVKATQEGVHFNTAEICKTNEKDVDSTPCNHKDDEDDIDRQCFTVPVKLCPGEKAEANVPNTLTNVQWFKDGGSTAIATGNVVLLTEVGTYTFTATNQACPANGCCPVIIEAGVNCCPEDLCIPFTIKKTKKK